MLWPIVLLPVLLLVTAATPAEDICSRPLSIAIYAQYESIAKKDMVIPCIENVVAARKIMTSAPPRPMQEQLATPHCVLAEAAFTLDIFVSFSNSIGSGAQQRILGRLGSLQGVSNAVHYTKYFPGFLEAPNAFIFMLNHSHRSIEQYDLSLKIRFGRPLTSKTAKHSVECMCGTPSQVVSIVQGFLSEKAVSAVGPQGFVFTQSSLKRNIAPFIDNDNKKIFNDITMKAVEDVSKSFPGGDGVDHGGGSHVLVIYGGTYWIRPAWMHFSEILPQLEALGANVQDIDQIIDVLLPTLGALGSGQVRAIMPAPKLLPLYFPQYHRIPQNDRFWGEGFTEWTLLKPLDLPQISKPLPVSEGGLGYYDLNEKGTRAKQAELNRAYGGYGFVYYHYWFSGNGAPADHKVMHKIPELMLKDGQPDMPFMFSWANEPWSRRWTGDVEDVMMEQNYGDEKEWKEHFMYLLQFFKHEKYIKYRGSPVFVLYRIGHFGDKLRPMLQLWTEMAIKIGFSGMYFITTIGNFYITDPGTADLTNTASELKAAMQFWPLVRMSFKRHQHGKDLKNISLPQYWGAHTGFDARPRIPDRPIAEVITPNRFEGFLKKMFSCLNTDARRWKSLDDNYIFITAFNEWNEQAVMEPGTLFGFGFLIAMRKAVQSIPFCQPV